jgi:hypothetical protein
VALKARDKTPCLFRLLTDRYVASREDEFPTPRNFSASLLSDSNDLVCHFAKKRAGSKSFQASSANLALLQISNDNSCGTDGGGNSGAGCNRYARYSSRSTDMVGSTGTDNNRFHNRDNHNSCIDSPDNQLQRRLKLARQNVAQERKPIPLPSMRSRKVFSL